MISLTEAAAVKVEELISQRPSATGGLRVGVRGGGCSGFTYFLEFAEAANEGDRELDSHGVSLYVDPKSFKYLDGTILDCDSDMLGQSLILRNPNAKSECGCGLSFGV